VKPVEPIPSCGDEYVDGILELLQTKQTSRRHDSALRMLRAHVAELVEGVKQGEVAQALLNEAGGGVDVLTLARQDAVRALVEEEKVRRITDAKAHREATARSFQLDKADALRLADALAEEGIRKGQPLFPEIERALVEAQARGEASAAEKVAELEERIEELEGTGEASVEIVEAAVHCAGAILSIVGIVSRDGEPRPCAEVRVLAEDILRAHGGFNHLGAVDEWTGRWVRG